MAHAMEEGAGFEPCCRRICSAPLIRMSFPSVDTAPLCYHRSGYEIDRGERNRTSLQAEHAGSSENLRGDYSDAPAGKESEVKKRPRPPIWDAAYYATRLRGIRDKLCHNLTRTAMITDNPSKP